MKKILILGAGEMQVPIIQKAKDIGVYSIVADYDCEAPGFAFADKKELVSTNDYEGLYSLAKKHKINGILTTSDFPVNIVAKISNLLGLSSMTESVASICTNKYKQRLCFQQSEIKIPYFKLFNKIEQIEGLKNYPYIIKPIDSSASRGVKKVISENDLKENFNNTLNYSQRGKILIEEFIDGREFSVETFTQNNITKIIAITEKQVIGENEGYFVEDTHIEPARVSMLEKGLIETEVLKAIKAIGINNCPTHTEVKLNKRGAFIVEIACRLGGDYITSDLVPLSTGIDMLGNLIRISLGEEIQVKQTLNKCSGVQFLNTTNYERCKSFIKTENIHIIRYEVKKFNNKEIKNSLDRLGYIIIQTDNINQMNSILQVIK